MILEFNRFKSTLDFSDKIKLDDFFNKIDEKCNIDDKENIKKDFLKSLKYYINNGISFEKSLELLDLKYLGNFYNNSFKQVFELDNIAKTYSFSVSYDFTSIFRISVYLDEDVIPEMLQMALNFTIKRFPLFATKFKRGFFWHYLEVSRKRYYIDKENDIPCQPINFFDRNSQLFRVLYFKNRISIEVFHILTDGYGATNFLKSLLAEYLRLIGKNIELDKNTIDVNSNIRKEELEDSLKNISLHNNNNNNYFGYIDKLAIQLDNKFTKNRPYQVIHFKLDSEKLKMVVKKYNTTVTGYLLSLMFVASKFCVTNNKGYLTITIPVNVRKFFSSETLRNFSLFCKIDFKIDDISDVSSIVDNVTFKLKQKSNIDSMNYMINSTNLVVKFWNFVPLIMKRTGAKNVYNFSSSYISSNILSNLGEIHLEDSISKYVEGFDCSMNYTMKSPFTCSVVTVKNVTTFTITKFVKNKKFEEKMYELFCDDELNPIVSGSDFDVF